MWSVWSSPSTVRHVLKLSNCNLTYGVFLLKALDPRSVFKSTSSYVNLVHSLWTVGFARGLGGGGARWFTLEVVVGSVEAGGFG